MTIADDYVNRVLDRMPRAMPRRSQIGTELGSHIAERVAAGHDIGDVLRQLGDPVALAESYLAEVPLVAAPHGRRLGAKLIDVLTFLMLYAIVLAGSFAAGVAFDADEVVWLALVIGLISVTIGFIAYTVWAEYSFGQTLGKRAFGLRVVRESGARIGIGQSCVRQLPSLFQVYWIDALFVLFTDRRQRAFELLSKTRVVDAKAQ